MSDKFMASGNTVKTQSDDDAPELCKVRGERLSAQIYLHYVSESPKAPVRWHEDKLQGFPAGLLGHSRVQDMQDDQHRHGQT